MMVTRPLLWITSSGNIAIMVAGMPSGMHLT